MNEPRPAMISARPPDKRSMVAKSWNTRTGSSELSTVTALVSRMRFVPFVRLYREAAARAGHDPAALPVAINTHAFVAEDSARATAAFAPSYMAMMSRIGRERGWPPMTAQQYMALRSPRGALAAGSPEEVAEKILFEHELFGHQRYMGQMSVGAVAHRDVLRSIELFATEVAPIVRAEVKRREAAAAA